jgi:putative flippase GtrA
MKINSTSIWREISTAIRFGFIGFLATTVHVASVWILLTSFGTSPITANTLSFIIAFGLSFTGHYLWTFCAPGNPCFAMLRFFLIALSGFIANTLLLVFFIQNGIFSPAHSAVFSVLVIPVISFVASRLWCFK